MRLPERISYRPRQKKLIAKNEPAIIRIETRSPAPPANSRYRINDRNFDEHIAPYLHGDWEEFDRLCRLKRDLGFEGEAGKPPVVYSGAEHPAPREDENFFKLPNITVIPNLPTEKSQGAAGERCVFGCTMGHYHPPEPSGWRVQEVYEFQSYGLMVLDYEGGRVEMWVARNGDKVAVPSGCHMTLYNLGDQDNPLITLDFADPGRNPSNKEMVGKCGPVLLAYYDEVEVVFTVNLLYINHPFHDAGVRLPGLPTPMRARQIRIRRGARFDLGNLLYEQLTQNPDVIGQFARLGIRIQPASPEAALEPLPLDYGIRLYFSYPLAEATDSQKPRTNVYRYFFPNTKEPTPGAPIPWRRIPTTALTLPFGGSFPPETPPGLNRPLVIVVEGTGNWVKTAYRNRFSELKAEANDLAVFYADDTRWKQRPDWADSTMAEWEVYLDKAEPEDFARYRLLRPDVVFIVTPDSTHSATARYWLGKAAMVFVEKPFDSDVKNIEDLQISASHRRNTEVRGLDHYQFYALPIHGMRRELDELLGGGLAKVEFYLTEKQAIGSDRIRSLQHSLTLDLLPHLMALLTFFGDVSSIDEIVVIEASQYEPLEEGFRNETASRLRFTFHDYSGNSFHVPCYTTVGKGFSQDVKYIEVTGRSGHALRIDFTARPDPDPAPDYPWRHLFFVRGSSNQPTEMEVQEARDPYLLSRTLHIFYDATNPLRLRRPLDHSGYRPLIEDLLRGTTKAISNSLSLTQGREIVRVLNRIWWAIQEERPWSRYPLRSRSPLEPWRLTRSYRDMAVPIYGHTQISTPSRDTSEPPAPILVRTRGRLAPFSSFGARSSGTLYSLVMELRRRAGTLPLTIVVHGWDAPSAEELLDVLASSLEAQSDAVWLIPGSGVRSSLFQSVRGRREDMIVLDLDQDTGRRIYQNLVADIVFFAAEEEADRVSRFQRRAHAVLIDQRGPQWKAVCDAARAVELNMFLWSGGNTIHEWEWGGVEEAVEIPLSAEPVDAGPPPALDEIGRSLKELTIDLEDEIYRRYRFRSRLQDVIQAYPDHANWHEDLARQADKHGWSPWAVQCLPKLYIPLPDPSPERKAALVWHYLLDSVPDPHSYEATSLCGGELREVSMTPKTAKFLIDISRTVEESLRSNPYWGDGAFNGSVTDALQEIESRLRNRDLAAANKVREVQKRFLTEAGISPMRDQ